VTVRNIQLASEGLLILDYKTTPLGGGQYHYEYALYNMNSDDSVRSFSIPIASGVTVTNLGFHDVTYRGGDGVGGVNYDGTDWPATYSGGNLGWTTTPWLVNKNANAIHWGATYSFRFDANSAPTTGTITIGTFKNAGTVLTTGDTPGGAVSVGTSFCFGDGSLPTMCPCFNVGNPGSGCANSQNPTGAILEATGTVSPDTVTFTCTGELPTALSIVLQGDGANLNGYLFGDGLRCVDGVMKRLYVKSASAGTVHAPVGADPSVTARSAALGDPIAPGSTRYYQIYYRDSNPTFCADPPGGTFNVSNGISITW
jgi:hypothetical protein